MLTVRSHVLALRSCTVRTPTHSVPVSFHFRDFVFVACFTEVASLRRMRRLLLVIAIQAGTPTLAGSLQGPSVLVPGSPKMSMNFTVWNVWWTVYLMCIFGTLVCPSKGIWCFSLLHWAGKGGAHCGGWGCGEHLFLRRVRVVGWGSTQLLKCLFSLLL